MYEYRIAMSSLEFRDRNLEGCMIRKLLFPIYVHVDDGLLALGVFEML